MLSVFNKTDLGIIKIRKKNCLHTVSPSEAISNHTFSPIGVIYVLLCLEVHTECAFNLHSVKFGVRMRTHGALCSLHTVGYSTANCAEILISKR